MLKKIYATIMPYFLFIIIGVGLGLFTSALIYLCGFSLCGIFHIIPGELLEAVSACVGFFVSVLFFILEG